ncbi:uncharacterized protein C11orf91 homolog [Tupaia chinensis]|uniref:uncharacterized protein C11orf91 homolog n=1 Tax=Tupaia chinensis TaxID=246437 RepID=UPI000FFB781A|nr:uncharacterized protein C11orf91 homolog [Tupaia chinensis]
MNSDEKTRLFGLPRIAWLPHRGTNNFQLEPAPYPEQGRETSGHVGGLALGTGAAGKDSPLLSPSAGVVFQEAQPLLSPRHFTRANGKLGNSPPWPVTTATLSGPASEALSRPGVGGARRGRSRRLGGVPAERVRIGRRGVARRPRLAAIPYEPRRFFYSPPGPEAAASPLAPSPAPPGLAGASHPEELCELEIRIKELELLTITGDGFDSQRYKFLNALKDAKLQGLKTRQPGKKLASLS